MTQTYAKNTTEVLIAAKWLLENVGWIKGQQVHYPHGGSVPDGFCASGAITWVMAESYERKFRAYSFLESEMDRDILKFNDAPHTTKQHVLDAFDRAIQRSKQ
jgi:hypothetical protein